jgi:hypothetical protein
MNNLPVVGTLGSGQLVIDRPQSHIHESVNGILPEAFSRIHLSGEQFTLQQVNFDQVVGETVCVVTNDKDEIVFAQRPRRAGLTRFVKNRASEPCRSLCVILKKADDRVNTYVLITAFIGVCPQPEPWDRNATEESVEFWSNHALIWGSEEVIPSTETSVCSWE